MSQLSLKAIRDYLKDAETVIGEADAVLVQGTINEWKLEIPIAAKLCCITPARVIMAIGVAGIV